MKSETREVYVADDGKVFETIDACQAHEREIAANKKRIERLKVWLVSSAFDGTEGRGYHRTTYIITDAAMAVVIEYCLGRFGRPLSGWYGDDFYETWHLRPDEMTADEALKRSNGHHYGVGTSAGEADVVFLSQKPVEHPELPKPVFPWPKAKKDTRP